MLEPIGCRGPIGHWYTNEAHVLLGHQRKTNALGVSALLLPGERQWTRAIDSILCASLMPLLSQKHSIAQARPACQYCCACDYLRRCSCLITSAHFHALCPLWHTLHVPPALCPPFSFFVIHMCTVSPCSSRKACKRATARFMQPPQPPSPQKSRFPQGLESLLASLHACVLSDWAP